MEPPYEVVVSACCTGCGVCVETCPTDVLRLDQASRRAFMAYALDCQACFVCQFDCPFEAIRVRHRGRDGTVLAGAAAASPA